MTQQIEQLGLKNIMLLGRISEKQKEELLRECLALILPSSLRTEAYGMVLIEASKFGRPMITCEIGTGTTYINEHNKTGLVVPPK